MEKEQLFQQAKALKNEGSLILKESGLLEFLAEYGKINMNLHPNIKKLPRIFHLEDFK